MTSGKSAKTGINPIQIRTSHQPVARSHAQIGDPTEADRILDRLVHNAHRIEGGLNEEEKHAI